MKVKINDYCCACSVCSKACPTAAPYYDGEKIAINYEKCVGCGRCVDACWLGAAYDADAPVEEKYETGEISCDFCVIGGGAAGLIAAVKATEAGKNVVIIEKGKKFAGSTPYATGLMLFDTCWDKEAGNKPAIEAEKKRAAERTNGEVSKALIDSAFSALPEFFDWCCQWAKPEEYFEMKTNPFGEYRVDCKDSEHGAGIFVINRFTKKCAEMGIKIIHSTSAKKLISKDGKFVAVEAENPAGALTVNFESCLIATGSVVNGELIKKVEPEYYNAFTRRYGHRIYSLSGDGVLMAENAGIPVNYDKISVAYIGNLCMPVDMQGIHFGRPIDTELLCQIRRPDAIRVNMNGKRWNNEGLLRDDSLILLEQPECRSWTILDSALMAEIVTDPAKYADKLGITDRFEFMHMRTPGAVYGKKADMSKIAEFAGLKGDHVVAANTVEELADKMHVPAKALADTVSRYNRYCANGTDQEFGKMAEFLKPIANPPYYAISTFLACDGAFGGLDTDENMHVLGANGPIDNLYAAGDVCSSFYIKGNGRKTTIMNDFSWAVASGYVAGSKVAES